MNGQESPNLTVDDFFKLTFGLTPIELDSTEFVTTEFTKELFVSLIEPSLKEQNPTGIFRNAFPYLVDIISRTIPIARLVNYIQEINENNDFDDIYQIFQRFEEFCTSRDFLIAFLDKVPTNSFSKILNTLVAANITIPIYLSNDTHSQKGLKVLNELRDIIVARKYHLFISVNQASTDYLETPFTKQLYKTYSNNREDCSGICNPNSIDISFHAASENHSRPPLAISEIYYDESSSSTLSDTVKILTKFAFYIVIHVSKNDFDGYELNEQFISTINDISIECYGGHKRKILILFWGIKPQSFKKYKEKIEKLLHEKFINNELWIELVVNNKKNALFERIKKDSFHKLKDTENPWIDWNSISFSKILGDSIKNFLSENDFALSIAEFGQFICRADIFYASYCENVIEKLRDKKHIKTLEDSQNYKKKQKNIGETRPISVLIYFANVIKKNDIKYMREFACQADVYFKDHLISLTQKDDEIKNKTVESDQSNIQREEIKQQIEELDITIHDFWREFVILSKIMRSDGSSVLKKLYDIDDKQLEKAYSVWIREGEPIQIIEGVSLRILNVDFLSSVLSQIMSNSKWQLIVLSIIGPESSGKSTLLNCLFQCGFSTSAGRCTKGAYMSYQHTFYKEKELDILIIDSEEMGSTAAKYILRHTDFNKKMTLFGLMCSQILIVNTKGLTRETSDTLEVSSHHLDALNNRDSNKPRICFILRDMKDAKITQCPAFLDIQEQDVHSLENAFACSFDDFYPQSMITDGENFHYPALTFPLKISKLRKELLDSALIPSKNHESQIFKNVHGFITHMQTVWEKIDVHGNFLHFKDSKTMQQWNAMIKIVHSYDKTTIKSYKENGLNWIEKQVSKGQWKEANDTNFENYLVQETEILCTKTIADFKEKISNQYEPHIIDEGEIYIKAAFTIERQELKTTYEKRQRQSKETWLIKLAEMRNGDTVGKFLESIKIKQMNLKAFFLSQNAIKRGRAISDKESNLGERLTFNRAFWCKVSTPETLNKLTTLNNTDENLNNSIKVKKILFNKFKDFISRDDTEMNTFKNRVINRIKTKIEETCEIICDDLLSRNALAIEFNQALEWLKTLCNNLFTVQDEFNNSKDQFKVKIEDFKDSTAKWKALQQNNLNHLRENLLKCFNNILSDSSYENISSHFFIYVDKSIEKYLDIQKQYISDILEQHLKQNWMSEERNPTRYAYEQSFGEYDVEKTRKYVNDPLSFMKELFENDIDIIKGIKVKERLEKVEDNINSSLEKLGEIISTCQQQFSGSSDKNLALEKIILSKRKIENMTKDADKVNFIKLAQHRFTSPGSSNDAICPESLIQDAIYVLGKCIISSPQDFYNVLKRDYDEYVQEFNTLWKTQHADLCKKSLIDYIETSKNSYWNKVKGCQQRCPFCGSKCELAEHEPNTNHRASFHLMACFNGFRNDETRTPAFEIYNEPKNFNYTYFEKDCKNELIFEEFTKKYYPEWWLLLGRKQPDDDQIKQVRAM
ncbi:16070_t:CDS:10 [Gigaspora margarita]|uniref:16070_t:CDS:1 n=1 Tax=Gigaspora margarita TaxID=4874 RepID=A0ABN7U5B2_GIGMA|nr:16070_t:CDS:10 [Gigaspora margarita]